MTEHTKNKLLGSIGKVRVTKSKEACYPELFPGAKRPRTTKFAFGYVDLAMFLGISYNKVKNLVNQGKLDPLSFEDIYRVYRERSRGS